MGTLPRFFVIQAPSNPKGPYLCPVESPNAANEPSHVLKFDESEIFGAGVKFEREESKTGDGTLVHIRSCFNNKYWVAHETSVGEFLIVASGDKPEEDGTNPGCTLFRVSTSSERPGFMLQSFKLGSYVRAIDYGPMTLSEKELGTNFSARDWEKLARLPPQVTFKTQDGKHLGVTDDDDGYNYNKFEPGLDTLDPRVGFQVLPTSHGYYRIKSLHHKKFWKRSQVGWIRNDSDHYDEEDADCIFEFIVTSDNFIAIRNLGNNLLCGWRSDCLTAEYPTTTSQTRLIIGVPVIRSNISITQYHLPRSRIFEGQVLLLANKYLDNNTRNSSQESLTFTESIETTCTWDNSLSVKTEETAQASIGIPEIIGGSLKLSRNFAYEREWGGNNKRERKIEVTTTVTVPKLTKMKVTLLCTKATCDVPFSYSQNDLLPDGRWVSTVKHDGIYTGVDAYDFRVTSVEVDDNGQELKVFKDEPATSNVKKTVAC